MQDTEKKPVTQLIVEVERRKIALVKQQQDAIASITVADNGLAFIISEAIKDYHAPMFRQCQIELDILYRVQA